MIASYSENIFLVRFTFSCSKMLFQWYQFLLCYPFPAQICCFSDVIFVLPFLAQISFFSENKDYMSYMSCSKLVFQWYHLLCFNVVGSKLFFNGFIQFVFSHCWFKVVFDCCISFMYTHGSKSCCFSDSISDFITLLALSCIFNDCIPFAVSLLTQTCCSTNLSRCVCQR